MYFVGWYFYGYYYYNHSHQYDKLPSPLLPIYLPMYLPTLFTFLLTYLPYQAAGNEKTKINKKKKMEMTSYGWFFYSFLYWGCNIYTRIPIFFLFYFLVVLFLLHQKKKEKWLPSFYHHYDRNNKITVISLSYVSFLPEF